jgi:hypothetical protein
MDAHFEDRGLPVTGDPIKVLANAADVKGFAET